MTATYSPERARSRQDRERARAERMSWFRALDASRAAHRRLSAIVRAALSPAAYQAARQEIEETAGGR